MIALPGARVITKTNNKINKLFVSFRSHYLCLLFTHRFVCVCVKQSFKRIRLENMGLVMGHNQITNELRLRLHKKNVTKNLKSRCPLNFTKLKLLMNIFISHLLFLYSGFPPTISTLSKKYDICLTVFST